MKKILINAVVILSMTVWSGCHEFLSINEDPNNPTVAELSKLLPSIQVDISGAVGLTAGGLSNYTSLYLHQTVQRGDAENDYGLAGDDFGVTVPWEVFYTRALTDLEEMIVIGEAEESPAYVGVAQILKAYTFSILVDIYGDVPFTEANQGTDNLSPSFDNDSDIYPQLFSMIDAGISKLQQESLLTPSTDDLIYGGDLAKWTRFGNTLKLKLYNQIRLVEDVSDEVTALVSGGNLIGPGDDFELWHGTNELPDDRNPAYREEYSGNPRNYVSPYFYEILQGRASFFPQDQNPYFGIQDPRIPYYFYNQIDPADEEPQNPAPYFDAATGFMSIFAFSFNIDPNEGHDQSVSQSILGLYPVGGAYDDGSGTNGSFDLGSKTAPQRMLTYYARKYIEAELALAGLIGGDPRELFEEAIDASFAKVNEIANSGGAPTLDDAEIDAYKDEVLALYDEADDDGKLQHIMTQKWIASFGFGVDMYTDYRRTGYPILHDGNTDLLDVTVRRRQFPYSFPYPTDNLTLNSSAPSQKQITSNSARIFWDID